MKWLLDTNVLSELRRPRPEPRVVSFVADRPLELLWVSSVTLAEIRFGIELVTDPAARGALSDWLTQKIRPMFAERVLLIDEEILLKWRLLVEEGRKTGYNYSQPDLLIAATALHQGLIVVTRNTRDFEKAGVPAVNPWEH
jgi:toxin FitB